MKKTTKNIIIALAALLILGIAAAVLMLTAPEAEPEEESSVSTALPELETLLDKTIDDVKNVVVETEETGETWTMIPAKSTEDAEANDVFTFEGWENEAVITDDVLDVAESFYSITATKEISDVTDLAEYGLDGDGVFKGVVTYKDGSKDTVIVGIEAGETYGRYILYNDSVYIVPMSSYLGQKQVDFIDTVLVAIPDETEPSDETGIVIPAEIQKMTLSGTNYPEKVVIQRSDDAIIYYEIAEPIFAGVSSSRTDSFIAQLQNITASGVAVVQATEEDLARYGQDEPITVLDYELNNEKHQLRLGPLDNGLHSLMIDDNTTIYMIDEASVDSWANASIFELRDGFIRLPNIKSVETLTVTAKDGTDVYDITRIKNEERSTETTPFYDLEVEKDGKAIGYDTAYQPFYQMLLGVYLLNEDIREPEGEPVLTVRYTYFDDAGYKDAYDEVKFYLDTENERRCIATLNDQPTGAVRASDIENILEKKPIIANFEALEEE